MNPITNWFSSSSIFCWPRKLIEKIIFKIVIAKYGSVVYFHRKEQMKAFKVARHIIMEGRVLLHYDEAVFLYLAVKSVLKNKGEFAEVGVYKGGSAKLM